MTAQGKKGGLQKARRVGEGLERGLRAVFELPNTNRNLLVLLVAWIPAEEDEAFGGEAV